MEVLEFLKSQYKTSDEGVFQTGNSGYWSNLSKDENRLLIESLKEGSTREALLKHQPWLEDVIFSPKRQAGLELLQLTGEESCIDYGCMWGALTVPLAKRTKFVVGIDQTPDSLRFLRARLKEENLSNVALLCQDLKKMPVLPEQAKVDVAIINGVLEWIPEEGEIELKNYYGKRKTKSYSNNPGQQQERFLKQVYENLNGRGKLYLAIENRFDFKMFMGVKDPHSNTLLTSVLPRRAANWLSQMQLGRPYVNWIYSFSQVGALLKKVGFSKVDLYMCFPDYRYPERIMPYDGTLQNFHPTIPLQNAEGKATVKRAIGRGVEMFTFKVLKAKYLSPSIIAIGHK